MLFYIKRNNNNKVTKFESRGTNSRKFKIGLGHGGYASQEELVLKNLPASAGDSRDKGSMLGQEDPLEKGMATHSSILA